MHEHGLEFSRPATFGRRRMAPQVCIVDSKKHIRKFLADALEELGFITHECAHTGELFAAIHEVTPDLVVLGVSTGAAAVVEQMQALGSHGFRGRILLVGVRDSPLIAAVQELGEKLGLAMLPAIGTPYRNEELLERVGDLIPREAPPSPPVDVTEALSAGWLELWYQAKIDTHTLKLAGAEALVRMRHPSWGIVPPACFVPGDNDPHFTALSEFVVARAIADWTYFMEEYAPIRLAINLPVAFLEDAESADRLRLQLPDHPAFSGLTVEISSSEVLRDLDLAAEIARRLRFHNIGISLDDLGGEWSLLSRLDEFPFVELKADGKFVKGCATERLKQAACRTLVDLAARFHVTTVAEGVETREDFHTVRAMGFDQVQGFLFHRPMPAQKFARTMLAAHRRAQPLV